MKRAYKALLTLVLVLALTLGLGLNALAIAAEPAEETVPYSGYLVVLRDAPRPEVELFSFFPETAHKEVPAGLLLLDPVNNIYKAEDLGDIRDLVYAGRVAIAEPDYQVELYSNVVTDPNDADITDQYNLGQIQVQAAWDAGLSGDGVTVAVIDSGLNAAHRDAPVKIGVGRYYYYREFGSVASDKMTDKDKDGQPTFRYTFKDANGNTIKNADGSDKLYGFFSNGITDDTTGHGTAVSGIIAANTNNGLNIAGIAPNATILPIRCFTNEAGRLGGYASNMIAGLSYAVQQHADIINMSWGLTAESQSLKTAITAAANAGCILIAAAGNDGSAAPRYPAAYDNVIGVGATNQDGSIANYSQRNRSVAVFAPGTNLWCLYYTSSTSMSWGSGTSFSAPTVAAVAALLREADPSMTQAEFLSYLGACSDPFGSGAPSYTDAGNLNVQRLVDKVGSKLVNVDATTQGYAVQACFHPSEAMAITDPTCLVTVAAYNAAGHMVASKITQATRSTYGGFQYNVTFPANTDVATFRAFYLKKDATLAALAAPAERKLGN